MYLCRTNAMAKRDVVFGRGSCLRSSFLIVWTFLTFLGVICGRQIDDFPPPKSPKTCGGLPDHCTGDNFCMPWSCPKSSCFPNHYYRFDNNSGEKSRLSANLSASVYYRYHNPNYPLKCQKVLNLTWTVKLNDSDRSVVGFLLRDTRVMLSKNINKTSELLLFLKQEQNMPVDKNGNTMFYYDCMRLSIASSYQFELFGLQQSTVRASELLAKPIGATNLITDCDVYPDGHLMLNSNSTYRGFIHVGQLDRDCSITAYFSPASDAFGFEAYNVQMISSGDVIKEVKNLNFTCENFGPVSFKNVVPGNYSLKVIPVGGRCPKCIPYQTPFSVSNSSDVCQTTTAKYRETTTAKYRETTTASTNMLTLPTSEPTSETPQLPDIGSSSMVTKSAFRNQSVIIAVAAVIVASVIVLAVVFLRYKSRKRRGEITVSTDDYYSGERDTSGDDSLTQQPVVLIYASDNRFHNNVVQCLAAYLQTQCHCDVRFDQWYQTQISEKSALDWILQQLKSVKNVIIINSEGGFCQCTADTMGFAYEKVVHETPLEDMFLPAMRELRNGYYLKPKPRKLFKVAFPYTDPEFCLSDFHCGISSQLMTHIEDLVLNIHGLSKHSRKGKTTMVGINQKDYSTSPEGCALEKAIRETTEYYKQNPNWFSEFYQKKERKDKNNVSSSVNRDWTTEHSASQNGSLYKSDPLSDYDYDSGFGISLPEDQQMEALFKAPDLDDASSMSSTSIELQVVMFNKDYDSMLDP